MSVLQRTLTIMRSGAVFEFDHRPVKPGAVRVASVEGKQIGVNKWLELTKTDVTHA